MFGDLRQRRFAVAAGVDAAPPWRLCSAARLSTRCCGEAGDVVAGAFDLHFRVEPGDDEVADFVAQVADPADHRFVLAADAVEVFGPGGEVFDPARSRR